MSWTPTDEQVETATFAAHDAHCPDRRCEPHTMDMYRRQARAVLVAVGPMIAAQAQREAAERMREYIGRDASTPYTQGWNRALEVVSDQIEKEAGR